MTIIITILAPNIGDINLAPDVNLFIDEIF